MSCDTLQMRCMVATLRSMHLFQLLIGLAYCSSETPARWRQSLDVPPARWMTFGTPGDNPASMCRDVHGCTDVDQDRGLQLPGRLRLLLQIGAGALTAGAGDASILNAGVGPSDGQQLPGQGFGAGGADEAPSPAIESLGPQLPSSSKPAASRAGAPVAGTVVNQALNGGLQPTEADTASTLPGAPAQVGAGIGVAQTQGSGFGSGPGASLVMGPQAGTWMSEESMPSAGASLPSTGAAMPSTIFPIPPAVTDDTQAGFDGSQDQLSVGAAGPSAGTQSALGQNSTASDDSERDASPASAPESTLGGIYDGVPAGGPSEALVDDGSEGAGPSAAPPVTAQDIYANYAALILGTGE